MVIPSMLFAQMSYERIVNADQEPEHWLTHSGNYASHRHTTLDQITRDNVDQLKVAWVYQVRRSGFIETPPLVVDGVMYLTEPPCTVAALDLRTGRRLWSWSPVLPNNVVTIGFPSVNRGVALLDDMV